MEEVRPLGFVLENVPGLANGIGKPIFLQILHRLNELGYNTVYSVVDTANYGVPQRRKRLVVMGINNPEVRLNFPPQTHSNPDLPGELPKWNTVRNTINDLPPIKAGEKHPSDAMHLSSNLSAINLKRIQSTPPDGGDRTSWSDELVLECHKKSKGHKDVYGRMHWDTPSPTITGGCVMLSKGRYGHPEQNRAISLREAARLQTFPDDFVFIGNTGQIAEQIGNAVPALLAKRAAEALLNSIEEWKLGKKIVD
jgi:DNA (cytosine-5)-methyltransferase 1